MSDSYEGWVIVHPSGELELTYFSVKEGGWTTKIDGYKEPVTTEFWMQTYRPHCSIIRMKLVPVG